MAALLRAGGALFLAQPGGGILLSAAGGVDPASVRRQVLAANS
jgi:hypothetical protein